MKKYEHLKKNFGKSKFNLVVKRGLQYFTFPELNPKNIFYGFTTKEWSKSGILRNFNFQEKSIVLLKQVHSDKFFIIRNKPKKILVGDALITNNPEIVIGIKTADCLPILIFNDKLKIISAIHAGWRGTAKKLTLKVLKALFKEFKVSLSSLITLLGPNICANCYEVDEEVKKEFQKNWEDLNSFLKKSNNNKYFLDLKMANLILLHQAGLNKKNIFSIDLCTKCLPEMFFSYRRDPQSRGRMLSFIGIK